MTALLVMLTLTSIIGLRRERFDLVSFGLIALLVLSVVVSQHIEALYGELRVK